MRRWLRSNSPGRRSSSWSDLPGSGRLGNVQALGGAADVFFFGYHFEVAQLA